MIVLRMGGKGRLPVCWVRWSLRLLLAAKTNHPSLLAGRPEGSSPTSQGPTPGLGPAIGKWGTIDGDRKPPSLGWLPYMSPTYQ